MTQLKAFEDRELPKVNHYDRAAAFNMHENTSLDDSKKLTEKEDIKLEEMVLGDIIDLKSDLVDVSSKLKKANMYGSVNKHNVEEIRSYLQRTHPKFANTGEQNIKGYSQRELFGLFNGLKKSYESKLKKAQSELNQLRKDYSDVFDKYNL